jgi:hypothetical protein
LKRGSETRSEKERGVEGGQEKERQRERARARPSESESESEREREKERETLGALFRGLAQEFNRA